MDDEQNSIFEKQRQAVIDSLKEKLSSASISTEEKELFSSVIDALEELTDGVNSAHVRIALRKKELQALNMNLNTLASAIRDIIDGRESFEVKISAQIEKQNKRNNKFYTVMCIAFFILVGFLAYISFGSKETLTTLSSLTQAFKLLDIII